MVDSSRRVLQDCVALGDRSGCLYTQIMCTQCDMRVSHIHLWLPILSLDFRGVFLLHGVFYHLTYQSSDCIIFVSLYHSDLVSSLKGVTNDCSVKASIQM